MANDPIYSSSVRYYMEDSSPQQYQNFKLKLVWVEETTEELKAVNKSKVKVTAYADVSGEISGVVSTFGRTVKNVKVTIDGSDKTLLSTSTWCTNGYNFGTHEKTVEHDGDGTKSITITCSLTISNTTVTGSGTVQLEQIPRGGKLTADKEVISSSDNTVTVTISPYLNTYKYVIDRKVGSKDWENEWKTHGATGTDLNNFTDTYDDIKARAGSDGNWQVQYRCRTYLTDSEGTQIGDSNTISIYTEYIGAATPLSLYQDGNNTGVHFGYESVGPGFYVYNKGPITVSTQAFTLDDGNSYYILGKWD